MALETLKGVTKLGDFGVIVMDDLKKTKPEMFNADSSMKWDVFERDIRPHNFVYVRNDKNSIAFTIQNGPIKENGINGCQVDTMVLAAQTIIEGLNDQFPCFENSQAIVKLKEALYWLEERKKDRVKRGVEGFSKD